MKKIAINTAIILATITLFVLIWQLREAVVLFLLSLGITAFLRPMVDFFIARGVRRSLSILLVYLITVGAIIFLFASVGGSLINDLQKLTNVFTTEYERIWTNWPKGNQFQQTVISQLPSPQVLYSGITGNQGNAIFQTLFGFTLSTFALISQVIGVLILSVYWSIDRVHFERLWLSLLPVEGRARAREIWRDTETGVGAYLRSEIFQSVLTGILLGFGLSLLQFNFPVLLAIFAALAWLIPWLGAVIAVIPILLVGLSINTGMGIAGALLTIIVLLGMELVIEPRIFDRRKYSSLLIVLFIIAFADFLGLIGIIIAPPLAAAVQIFFRHIFTPSIAAVTNDPVHQIADLGDRVDQIHSLIESQNEPPSPQAVNMLDRLDKLVQKAQDITEDFEETRQPIR